MQLISPSIFPPNHDNIRTKARLSSVLTKCRPASQFSKIKLVPMSKKVIRKEELTTTKINGFFWYFRLFADVSYPAQIIEGIRQHYRTREERVLPDPWRKDFSYHLNDIFTRLKIASKEKTRGTLTDETTNLTGIFRGHKYYENP